MDRFDKFTDRARKVLTLAQDEAQRFNHNYIGTEHLLLGLVREGRVAARVLENMNVELSKVRQAVEFIIGRGERPVVGEVGLTPRAKASVSPSTRLAVWAQLHRHRASAAGSRPRGRGDRGRRPREPRREPRQARHQVIHVLSQSSANARPRSRSAHRRHRPSTSWAST